MSDFSVVRRVQSISIASPTLSVIRLAMSAVVASSRARFNPSSSNAAIGADCSIIVTVQPNDASTKASRPSPAVASITVSAIPVLMPTARASGCPAAAAEVPSMSGFATDKVDVNGAVRRWMIARTNLYPLLGDYDSVTTG